MKKNYLLIFFTLTLFSVNSFAQIGINTGSPNSKSALDIVVKGSHAGLLFPRLTEVQRNNISPSTTEDGLTIYNIDTKCLNYWDSTKTSWQALCGSESPSIFSISDCLGGSSGTYSHGVTLTANNTYTIKVNVTQTGDYNIVGTTGNGYSFSKSGTFTATGIQSVTLSGSGIPVSAGIDTVNFTFNDISAVLPSCGALPTITVS